MKSKATITISVDTEANEIRVEKDCDPDPDKDAPIKDQPYAAILAAIAYSALNQVTESQCWRCAADMILKVRESADSLHTLKGQIRQREEQTGPTQH